MKGWGARRLGMAGWVVLALCAWGAPAIADDLFVTPGGAGSACTQGSPCALQTALDGAASGDVLYVGQGTYTGTGDEVALISESLSLLGGWNGAPSGSVVRDPSLYPSILDGESTRRVITIDSGYVVTLDGLVIRNGSAVDMGAGIFAQGSDLTLRTCILEDNLTFSESAANTYGGGLYFEDGTLAVNGCTFEGNDAACDGCQTTGGGGLYWQGAGSAIVEDTLFQNNDAWYGSGLYFWADTADDPLTIRRTIFDGNGKGLSVGWGGGGYGGGVSLANGHVLLEDCSFHDNDVGNEGGALRSAYSDMTIRRCRFLENTANDKPGLDVINGDLDMSNCVVADNMANWAVSGALVLRNSGTATLRHNSFARNMNESGGYGVEVQTSASATLGDNIIVGHGVGLQVWAGGTADAEATLWGSGAWANTTDTDGTGSITLGTINIHGDPAFVGPDDGDYHIQASSAARDAGVDADVDDDMDLQARPFGAGYDIGADEFVSPPVITLMNKLGNPFRINVAGSNLQDGIAVYIDGHLWGDSSNMKLVKWKNESNIKIKKGSALKALVPKNAPTTFRFINPDGGEVTLTWQWP